MYGSSPPLIYVGDATDAERSAAHAQFFHGHVERATPHEVQTAVNRQALPPASPKEAAGMLYLDA